MSESTDYLILAAVTAEVQPLVQRLRLRRDHTSDADVISYAGRTAAGRNILAAVTGVGRERASSVTTLLLDRRSPRAVLSIGFAGGANPALAPAAVIVPSVIIDARSAERLQPSLSVAAEGTLKTVDTVIARPAQKADLFRLGVDAVDMETAEIAAVCDARGVPWAGVRAISDAADQHLPAYAARLTLPDGRPAIGATIRFLLVCPCRIGQLIALGRRARRAADALAGRVIRLLDELDS